MITVEVTPAQSVTTVTVSDDTPVTVVLVSLDGPETAQTSQVRGESAQMSVVTVLRYTRPVDLGQLTRDVTDMGWLPAGEDYGQRMATVALYATQAARAVDANAPVVEADSRHPVTLSAELATVTAEALRRAE